MAVTFIGTPAQWFVETHRGLLYAVVCMASLICFSPLIMCFGPPVMHELRKAGCTSCCSRDDDEIVWRKPLPHEAAEV